MRLSHSKILKFLFILLFSFELFAPVLVPASSACQNSFSKATVQQAEQTQSFDFFSHFIFEEVSSEEREGKDDFLTGLCYRELFSELQKFETVQITWPLPKEHFDTHPPLFTLHRELLI